MVALIFFGEGIRGGTFGSPVQVARVNPTKELARDPNLVGPRPFGTLFAQKGSFGLQMEGPIVCWSKSSDSAQAVVDPRDAAESAGLRYVSDDRPGIRRKKAGSGFTYTRADGSRLTERDALKRIKALAIPPAWTDVWICPFADGHIQATGRDARRRKQYRYHPLFREVREGTKYEHLIAFADALPSFGAKVRAHMGLRGLSRGRRFWRRWCISSRPR